MDVVRWEPVSTRWFRHRPEPLLHERLWGCDLVPEASEAEAGYDADGRAVAWRMDDEQETVEHREGEVVVRLADGGTARTTLDGDGRPVRTTYEGTSYADEVYGYDEQGRLTTIDESDGLWSATVGSERLDTGGRLTVERDGERVVRIAEEGGGAVYERPTVPWAQRLAEAAGALAAQARELIGETVEEAGLEPGTETYGVSLVYVDQGSLQATIAVGLEADRRAAGGGEHGAMETLYIEGELPWIEADLPPEGEDRPLLRDACIGQPEDPYRTVLGAVAWALADGELPGLRKTQDFVAWVAEHDEGFDEKFESIRRHNPPDAVARWERGWGALVLPYGEEAEAG